jgi:hypothetical protein
MNVRNELASEIGLSAQKICNNSQLSALTKLRPSIKKNLERVEGFPIEKIDTIGAKLVEKIVLFCNKFNLNKDNFDKNEISEAKTSLVVRYIWFICFKSHISKLIIFLLF